MLYPSGIKERLRRHRAIETHGSPLGPVIHDIVFGAHDGIITTFAVIAGTVGADLPAPVIIILGIANLIADGVSMGAGAYLSLKSADDQYERIYKEEMREIDDHPDVEREEIAEAYEKKGFKGEDLRKVVDVITGDKQVWTRTMMLEEHGLIKSSSSNPLRHAAATFLGFVAFGAVPLFPYIFGIGKESDFFIASASAFAALLLIGIMRGIVTRERLMRGMLEILAIGAASALIAYGIGAALRGIVGAV